MDTLYRKVEIKSEQDLPENDTYCFCHHKHKGERWDRYLTNYNKDWWLMNIDWYLQPVEPQEPKEDKYCQCYNEGWTKRDGITICRNCLKPVKESIEPKQTVEEILDLQQYVTNLLYAAHNWGGHDFDKWVEEHIGLLKEYASQSQSPALNTEGKIKEARRLMFEVTEERRRQRKLQTDNQICECGHSRNYHAVSHSINYTEGFCSPDSATFRQLKRRIDYYLQPVETKQAAEEILKDELSDNIWYDISTTPVSYGSKMMIKDWIIEAMERYASQDQQR